MGVRRVLIVTGRQAYSLISEIAEEARRKLGVDVEVVALPLSTASLISTEHLLRFLPVLRPDYKSFDVVMVPGKSSVDPEEASRRLGVRIVKGPVGAGDLHWVLREMVKGRIRSDYSTLGVEIEDIVRSVFARAKRVCVGGACVRLPPAYTLVVEVVPGSGMSEVLELVLKSRPDFIVLGDEPSMSDEDLRSYLVKLRDAIGDIPFGIETSRVSRMKMALEMGAVLVSGVSASSLPELVEYRDKAFFVLQPYDEQRGMYPRNARDKLNLITKGLEVAEKLGFEGIIIDPIVIPPPLGFVESLEPYRVISEWSKRFGENHPLLFSLASIEDALGTDAFPVFVFAAGIGYELRASVYWVVAKRGFEPFEARAALNTILASLERRVLPADLGVDLTLLGKGDLWAPSLEGEVVEVGRVEAREFDKGYARIGVHRGEIVVEYVEGNRRRVYRGRNGLSIARMIVHDFRVNPEHAAYLGYQLARAEIAAKLGLGFTQDEEYKPPFERLG